MSFPRKIYWQAILILIIIFLDFVFFIAFDSYISFRDATKYGIIFSFLVGFFFYPLSKKIIDWADSFISPNVDKLIDDAKNAQRGFEGEDEVSSWLDEIAGKDNFVRNVELPNRKFDIDMVVVGNKGIIALEVKNFSNPVRFENDEYYCEKDGKLILISPEKDPRIKLRKHTHALVEYLNNNGFGSISINKTIIFVNGKVSWDGQNGVYIIKDKASLQDYLEGLEIDSVCTSQVCEEIKKLLRKNSKANN